MYENIIILIASSILSLIIVLYSIISVDKNLKSLVKPFSTSAVRIDTMNYITRKKELEYMKELLQDIVARIYKEYGEGKISGEEKNILVDKFKKKLLEVDQEINEVSLYAELESLEGEYKKLVSDYEQRKKDLEEKINGLKKRIRVKEEKTEVKKPEEKEIVQSKPTTKTRVSKEADLSSLMKELSEMMKRLEEGEE